MNYIYEKMTTNKRTRANENINLLMHYCDKYLEGNQVTSKYAKEN